MRGSGTFAFCNPGELAAGLADLRMHVLITGPGRFHASLTQVECRIMRLALVHEALPRIAHLSLPPGTTGIVFATRERQTAMIGGTTLDFGKLAVLGAGYQCYMRSPADFDWASITFRPDQLDEQQRRQAGIALDEPDTFRMIQLQGANLRRLQRLCQQAAKAVHGAPDLLRATASARGLEDALVEALVACLSDGAGLQPDPRQRAHVRTMNRFHDLLQAEGEMRFGTFDPATMLGVSRRSLRSLCREQLGMGLEGILRLQRMNRTRLELECANSTTSSVKAIAAKYGFHEPGRFAVHYRKLFGESPSATLRRSTALDAS
jgi:AraC-like DNA-binding protein